MEPLTWTGILGPYLNPILLLATAALIVTTLVQITVSAFVTTGGSGNVLTVARGPADYASIATKGAFYLFIAAILAYLIGGILVPGIPEKGIIGALSTRLLPVWIALGLTFGLSYAFRKRLGLWGKVVCSPIGAIGAGIVLFWVFTGLFAELIATHGPLDIASGMKNKVPGTPLRGAEEGEYQWYLLGGDALTRDVFSRVVHGSTWVMVIAPLATMFAFMVGISLGVPAGFFGGTLDMVLSFLANLILAFPVILLFYLLVTPEIVDTGLPIYMAAVLFLFPILFLAILFHSKFHTQPTVNTSILVAVIGGGGWLYLSLLSTPGTIWNFLPSWLDLFNLQGNFLIVFVSVVFVNSPTVFRIVRGLVLDIKTRDYVAAAHTRGEGVWYTMLWEILPNARGPLIVDFCLRIGYTTILLGTLGFFGLGLESESPDWGSTINTGRKLIAVYIHPLVPPALALMSLVLGLNLLADGLREESLKD
ncbi:MAG: ABC transporter permease [Pseudomonadota bacterium]